jgi:hypothetical protein
MLDVANSLEARYCTLLDTAALHAPDLKTSGTSGVHRTVGPQLLAMSTSQRPRLSPSAPPSCAHSTSLRYHCQPSSSSSSVEPARTPGQSTGLYGGVLQFSCCFSRGPVGSALASTVRRFLCLNIGKLNTRCGVCKTCSAVEFAPHQFSLRLVCSSYCSLLTEGFEAPALTN